jgi:predicted amidophosphoribosyltransferase
MTDNPRLLCPKCNAGLPPLETGTESLTCPCCGKTLTAYEAGMQEVRAYIRQSALVNAIGRYRRLTGADLKTAKDIVAGMWHNGDW